MPTIDIIPHEILSQIFLIIAQDPTMNPVLLSRITHVCSQWRTIALSTGSLWTRIVLTYPISDQHPSYIVAWLSRSGAQPLDILLDLRDPNWDWDEDSPSIRWQEMETIVRLILPHVNRWRSFDLLTDTWAPIFTFLWYARKVEAAPMLERLSLSRCNAYFAARGQTFQPSSLAQPMVLLGGVLLENLEDLTLVGVHLDWNNLYLPGLTQLELKYHASGVMPTFNQFRTILSGCPHLNHLSIYGWGPILDASSKNLDVIHLPTVTKLSIGVLDTIYAIQFLSLLDLPSLTSLVLEDVSKAVNPVDITDAALLLSWFISHTDRSAVTVPYTLAPESSVSHFPLHQIQSLELHGIVCANTSILASFLRQLPSVTCLGLRAIDNSVLSYLSLDVSETEGNLLLPNLTELNCQDMDPEMLLALVASRRSLMPNSGGGSIRACLEFLLKETPAQGSQIYTRLLDAGIEVSGSVGSDTGSGTTSRRPSIF